MHMYLNACAPLPAYGLLACNNLSRLSTIWQAGAGKNPNEDFNNWLMPTKQPLRINSTQLKCKRVAVVHNWSHYLHTTNIVCCLILKYQKCHNTKAPTHTHTRTHNHTNTCCDTHIHTFKHTHTQIYNISSIDVIHKCTVIYSGTQKSFMQISGFPVMTSHICGTESQTDICLKGVGMGEKETKRKKKRTGLLIRSLTLYKVMKLI